MSMTNESSTATSLDALVVYFYATQRYGDGLRHQVAEYRKLADDDEAAYTAMKTAPAGASVMRNSAAQQAEMRGLLEARQVTAEVLRKFITAHPLVARYAAVESAVGSWKS